MGYAFGDAPPPGLHLRLWRRAAVGLAQRRQRHEGGRAAAGRSVTATIITSPARTIPTWCATPTAATASTGAGWWRSMTSAAGPCPTPMSPNRPTWPAVTWRGPATSMRIRNSSSTRRWPSRNGRRVAARSTPSAPNGPPIRDPGLPAGATITISHADQEDAHWAPERYRRESEAAQFAQAVNDIVGAQHDQQAAADADRVAHGGVPHPPASSAPPLSVASQPQPAAGPVTPDQGRHDHQFGQAQQTQPLPVAPGGQDAGRHQAQVLADQQARAHDQQAAADHQTQAQALAEQQARTHDQQAAAAHQAQTEALANQARVHDQQAADAARLAQTQRQNDILAQQRAATQTQMAKAHADQLAQHQAASRAQADAAHQGAARWRAHDQSLGAGSRSGSYRTADRKSGPCPGGPIGGSRGGGAGQGPAGARGSPRCRSSSRRSPTGRQAAPRRRIAAAAGPIWPLRRPRPAS